MLKIGDITETGWEVMGINYHYKMRKRIKVTDYKDFFTGKGLPCMVYRVTTTANGKLKHTACYVLGGLSALNLI